MTGRHHDRRDCADGESPVGADDRLAQDLMQRVPLMNGLLARARPLRPHGA